MFSRGLRDGIPIGLGYFSVSFSFGIIAVSSGLTWWEALLISMTTLTSAGQFAGVTVMAAAGSLVEMAITQLVINLRYALMSISLSQKVDEKFKGIYRMLLGFGMTDEIFAVAMNSGKNIKRAYFFGLMVIPYIGWSLGTLSGAICGNILPDIVCDALGIALYGMFIAIVVPGMKRDKSVAIVVAIAIGISCILYYLPIFDKISSGFSVIICSVIASAVGAILFPEKEKDNECLD